MSHTRESERSELHRTTWKVSDDLRSSVDGWDVKSYVLGMLFCRFISVNLTAYLNRQERRAGHTGFDCPASSDRKARLRARRQRYEYYRNRLLSFREAA